MPGGRPPPGKMLSRGVEIEIGPHIHARGSFQGMKIEPGVMYSRGSKINIGPTGKTMLSRGQEIPIGPQISEAEAVAFAHKWQQQHQQISSTRTVYPVTERTIQPKEEVKEKTEKDKQFEKTVKEKNPKTADDWYGLANNSDSYCQENRIRFLDKVIELDPKYQYAWLIKGGILDDLRRYEEAIKCYEKFIELNPTHFYKAIALNCKGDSLFCLSRYEEAIKFYEDSLKFDSSCFIGLRCWENKKKTFSKMGKQDEVEKCFNKIIELFDKELLGKEIDRFPSLRYDYWVAKGNTYIDWNKYKEAIKCFDKATEINPKRDYALYKKGLLLKKLGNHIEAIKCFNKATKKEQNSVANGLAKEEKDLIFKELNKLL